MGRVFGLQVANIGLIPEILYFIHVTVTFPKVKDFD